MLAKFCFDIFPTIFLLRHPRGKPFPEKLIITNQNLAKRGRTNSKHGGNKFKLQTENLQTQLEENNVVSQSKWKQFIIKNKIFKNKLLGIENQNAYIRSYQCCMLPSRKHFCNQWKNPKNYILVQQISAFLDENKSAGQVWESLHCALGDMEVI